MLHHKIFGEGNDGPPLVILHGLFGMLDNWQTLARRWAGQHKLILVDLRNHGRSPHEPEMNYDLMATDVAELLEALGHDHCCLLGHSMGGKVAMRTALKFPGLVEKLIVVDIAPRAYAPGHSTIFAALEALDPASVTDRKDAGARMAEYVSDQGIQLFLLKNLARDPAGGYRWRMNLPVIAANYAELISGVAGEGEVFSSPALFLRGGRSGYVQDEDWPMIQAHFSAATLVTIAEAGHWVHAERPEELMAAVDAFLAG